MLSRQRINKLFWLFVFILSFHFRETFQKQAGILFPDGLSDRSIQHIHTQPGPVERLCGAFGISCQELQGWIGNNFFKKKSHANCQLHVKKCFRKMNLRLYSSDRPARVFWPQNEGVSNSQRLNVVKLMCIPLTLLGFFGYMAST